MQIQDKVAVVVGGASGMARATAYELASAGAKIAIFDLPISEGAKVAADIGQGALFCPLDVTDAEAVESAIDRVMDELGAIHIGINVAGGGAAKRTVSRDGPHPLDEFRRVIELNLVATFNLVRLQADRMSRNQPEDGERGVIVNTSSIAAFEGQIGQVAYASAKSGIIGLTFTAARDLGSLGIRVLAIAPSLFDTGLTKLAPAEMKEALVAGAAFPRRMGRPEEYARLARAIVETPMLNGTTIRLDAAQRFGPK
ncbi:MAG: SDR family NAD(P)-dependent oxidoreductase [Deltaproteobacteria bacterium]|nr:SDR family NAD(P)-dependent oxidoreductase [Deltaproteobacteria bacterium]MBW2695752.1 SDR family NAD(P)-dependent oxidoreductase [Deltaproteobacteria bacterium]